MEKINLSGVINELYIEEGRDVSGFIRALARKFYGDLLAKFKFEVKRVYTDRNQRKSLAEIDPTGIAIIKC